MQQNAIELFDLTHRFGRATALDHLNLALPEGRIYGLLGRNGAGKSTLINILIAGFKPTHGRALVFGETPFENGTALSKLCVVREQGMFPPYITVRQVLTVCKGLYPNWDKDYAESLLKLFELKAKKRFRQLSRGMESSLGLIIGLASRAELTVFDEPSLGLDAVARENFYDALEKDLREHPRTIIISTHMIDEAARCLTDVVVMDKGKILLSESISNLGLRFVTLSGDEQAVKALIGNRRIIKEDRLHTMYAASVQLEEGSSIEKIEGVDVSPMPLQKLFVLLTNPEGGEVA